MWTYAVFSSTRFLLTHPVWDVTGSAVAFLELDTFLLTHPVWDVTPSPPRKVALLPFLLTHPVWDVTDPCKPFHLPCYISTHTSRVGCDMTP